MEEKSKSILKSALIPGVILGAILILISLVSYIFDLLPKGALVGTIISLSTFAIRIIVLTIFTKQYREKVVNGFISYGRALGFGVLVGIYASLIIACYNFTFNTVIDPDYTKEVTEKVQKMSIDRMYESGASDEMIEQIVKKTEEQELPSPLKSSLIAVGTGILFSFLASLVSSAFAKKNEDPYQAMQDINEE